MSPCQRIRKLFKIADLAENVGIRVGSYSIAYRHSSLMDFFTPQVINDLGSCTCDDCKGCNPPLNSEDMVHAIRDPGNSYVAVLAFLLMEIMDIKPIGNFIQQGYSDQKLSGPEVYSSEAAGDTSPSISVEVFRELLKLVDGNPDKEYPKLFPYFLPTIHYEKRFTHRSLGDHHVLPFRTIEQRGQGGYSTVYSAQMLKGSHNFKDAMDGMVAIKLYSDPSFGKTDCAKEMDNNSRCDHENVMPLQAAIDHMDTYIHIYPLAEKSLQDLFKGEPYDHYPEPRYTWRQFTGLLRGLHHIHTANNHRIGYHFDLKPHNILLWKGRWAITDLGLAHSKELKDSEASATRRREGSDEWGPPQWERVGRGYDVWALGCIGCVVLAWLTGGVAGVEQFRQARRHAREGGGPIQFVQNFYHDRKEALHPAVDKLLEDAEQKGSEPTEKDEKDRHKDRLISDVAKILRSMLKYSADGRPTALQATEMFDTVLQKYPLERLDALPPPPPRKWNGATLTGSTLTPPTSAHVPRTRKHTLEVPGALKKRQTARLSHPRPAHGDDNGDVTAPVAIVVSKAGSPHPEALPRKSDQPQQQQDEAYETSAESDGEASSQTVAIVTPM